MLGATDARTRDERGDQRLHDVEQREWRDASGDGRTEFTLELPT